MLVHAVRHEELGVLGPSVAAFGQADLLLAERLAVGGAGIVLVGSAIADMAIDDDERRDRVGAPETLDGLGQPLLIVGVADLLHVPAIGKKARRDILTEAQTRLPSIVTRLLS